MTRKVVIPGEEISDQQSNMNVFKAGGKSYSAIVGLLEEKEGRSYVIPLNGKYTPQEGDYVVGVITDVKFGGCIVDINCPYHTFMPTREEYNFGDVISATVTEVNEMKNVILSHERKLMGGTIIDISPVKVPRVIGKKSSMLNMIKDLTGSNMFVGRNGRIWLRNGDIVKAEEAVSLIERNAHTGGLTEKVKSFLEKK